MWTEIVVVGTREKDVKTSDLWWSGREEDESKLQLLHRFIEHTEVRAPYTVTICSEDVNRSKREEYPEIRAQVKTLIRRAGMEVSRLVVYASVYSKLILLES